MTFDHTHIAGGPPVWFISDCCTGFGRELARCVLVRGARAVLPARDRDGVADLTQGHVAAEVAPLGNRVTCIEPGPFGTDLTGRSLRQTPPRIAGYDATVAGSGSQPGDPARAAEAIVRVGEHPRPPRHLVLGSIGATSVASVLPRTFADNELWHAASVGADFPSP